MSSEYKPERLSAKTLIWVAVLSICLTVFWNFFEALLPQAARCTQRVNALIPTPGSEFVGGPFVALLAVMALQYIQPFRRYLTRTNLAYLCIATIAVSFFSHYATIETRNTAFLLARPLVPESVGRYVPWFVSLPSDVADMLITGVGDLSLLPWDILLPAVLWRFLLVALFAGIGVSMVNIFRREWIDIERIPFPYATVVHSCMINIEHMKEKKLPSRNRFLMGMLLGFLLAIPLSGATLFPWFPDLYMWRTNTCGPGSHWIAPPDIPWHLGIAKHPPVYAFLLLIPVHVLFSAVFYTLVFEIALFASFYGFGAYTAMLGEEFCGRNWCISPYSNPPLYFSTINTGAALGLFVITIFLERRYIVETLKVAFGRFSEKDKLEAGEPMSYRAAWTMLIVFFILMVAFFLYTGLSPWLSFVVPFVGVIIWIVLTHIWGRIGFIIEACYDLSPGLIRLMAYPTQYLPQITSTDLIVVPLLSVEWIGHTAGGSVEGGGGWGASFFTPAISYKIASFSGIHPRNALKVMTVAMLIAAFISALDQVVIPGLFGFTRLGYNLWDYSGEPDWHFWTIPYDGPISDGILHLTIGFIFMIVMRYLYTRFLWIPDPVVAIIAWSWEISLHGLWFPCLVAWIIKSAILRIGGSKLYEECVVPFVGGFILGDALETFLAALTSFILFPPTL
ncbi:hypothetical protein DRO58_08485 [Candidatus Bathyarchaeota archaeon]|nr:MAG: hypothetical protein DRO58_08485 [Candidatus Bathyarchaeota archaeon]